MRHRILLRKAFSTKFSTDHSFAMSGCGWLWPFYLGVIKHMKSEKVLTDKSIVAGTSGGSLGALVATANIEPELALDFVISLSKNVAFQSNIDKGLKEELRTILPHNVLELCNGRLHITTTKLWPNPKAEATIISHFNSNEELVDVLAASCYIPMYSDSRLSTTIHGYNGFYADGGVFAFMPPLGDIRVTPFNNIWVRPLCNEPHIYLPYEDYSITQLLYWSLKPAEPAILQALFEKGEIAAKKWTADNHLKF